MTMQIGSHVRSDHPLEAASARGADVIQMFISNPQSWKKPVRRDDAAELLASGLPIYIHAPYLINIGSPNNRVRFPSRKMMADTVQAAAAIGARGLIVHGGHIGDDEDLPVAWERWFKALEPLDLAVPVLIENTAGGKHAAVREIDNYGPLWEVIGGLNVGVCIDTCHAWAAGERDPHDSRRDRHANLGEGMIPEDLILHVVREADAPVVVETPDDDGGQAGDIAWLRERLG